MSEATHEAMLRVLLTHLRRKQRRGVRFERWGHRILLEIDGRFRILEVARSADQVITRVERCRVFGLDAALKQLKSWGLHRAT
jgi:hypothetical protein